MVFSCSAGANFRCRAPSSSWGSLSLWWRWEAGRGALLCCLPLHVLPSTDTSIPWLWIRSLLIGWRRCWWAKQGVAHSREVWWGVTVTWMSWWVSVPGSVDHPDYWTSEPGRERTSGKLLFAFVLCKQNTLCNAWAYFPSWSPFTGFWWGRFSRCNRTSSTVYVPQRTSHRPVLSVALLSRGVWAGVLMRGWVLSFLFLSPLLFLLLLLPLSNPNSPFT